MQTNFLENFKKRFSCKNFDTKKKISDEILSEILEVVRLSPSMLNLQPWKIFVIESPLVKMKLQNFSGNQAVVSKNSHYLVFARRENFDEDFLQKISENYENPEARIENLKNFLNSMDEKQKESWGISQVSIAMGSVIAYLSEKWIDSCPIGVLDRQKYDEFLKLKEKWFATVFGLAIGYKSEEKIFVEKNRLNLEEIFIKI